MAAQDLLAWFHGNAGYLHPRVTIQRQSDGAGLRLVWNEAIEKTKMETIVRCPGRLVFSILQIPVLAPWWPTAWLDSYDTTTLTRFLLVEAFLQRAPHLFGPYIDSLPQPYVDPPFATPIFWNDEQLSIIRGTNLHEAAVKRKRTWEDEFEQAKEHLLRVVPDRHFHIIQYSSELYFWAATVLTSRCFPHMLVTPAPGVHRDHASGSPREQNFVRSRLWARWLAEDPLLSFPILLPVMDLANHSPSAEVQWGTDGNHVEFLVDASESSSGVEIFNNYGQKSNEELVLGYGFDLTPNTADSQLLRLSDQLSSLNKIRFVRELAEKSLGSSATALPVPQILNPSTNISDLPKLYALRDDQDPFSSAAATPLAFMVMNTRELRARYDHPFDIPNFASEQLPTRQGLQTLTAFAAKLRINARDIRKENWRVPLQEDIAACPTMQMALRYRQSQLQIIDGGLASLRRTLKKWQDTDNVVDLEDFLTSVLTRSLLKRFRQLVHHTVGTRDLEKIREMEMQEPVLVYWVLNLIMEAGQPDFDEYLDPKPEIMMPLQLRGWLAKMQKSYGDYNAFPLEEADPRHTSVNDRICWTDYDRTNAAKHADQYESELRHHNSVVDKPGYPLVNMPGFRQKLEWALRVVREEVVWLPDWLNTKGEREDWDGPKARVMAMVLMEPERDE